MFQSSAQRVKTGAGLICLPLALEYELEGFKRVKRLKRSLQDIFRTFIIIISTFFLPFGIYNANNNSDLSRDCDRTGILPSKNSNILCDNLDNTPVKNKNTAKCVLDGSNAEDEKSKFKVPVDLSTKNDNLTCDKSKNTSIINDNHTISINKSCDSNITRTVYITKTGKCYHNSDCYCLSESKIAISEKQARKNNYVKCSKGFG